MAEFWLDCKRWITLNFCFPFSVVRFQNGELAQLGERLLCTGEALSKSQPLGFCSFARRCLYAKGIGIRQEGVVLAEFWLDCKRWITLNFCFPFSVVCYQNGELAQLGERLLCTQEVSGSIPLFSTKEVEHVGVRLLRFYSCVLCTKIRIKLFVLKGFILIF